MSALSLCEASAPQPLPPSRLDLDPTAAAVAAVPGNRTGRLLLCRCRLSALSRAINSSNVRHRGGVVFCSAAAAAQVFEQQLMSSLSRQEQNSPA